MWPQEAIQDKLDFIAKGGKLSDRIKEKYGVRKVAEESEMKLFDVVVKAHDRESAMLDKLQEKSKWRRDSNLTDSTLARVAVAALDDQIPEQIGKARKRSSILRDLAL